MLKTLDQANSLGELYSTVQDDLIKVESLLASELTSQFPAVNQLLTRSNRLSGKRLRPALLLLFGKAAGKVTPDQIKLAAAIEMIHTATLVHDDILDSADQRRHAETINHEFGNQSAILTGDFLFSHAFYLTSTLATTYAAREIGKATNKVCEGEIRQIGTKQQYETTEDQYLEIIDAKTAVLCSCAAKLGAYYGEASEDQVEAAALYGTYLGIAFQIVDDILDLVGNESETGKSLGTDLAQHKPTLPLIHHLASLDPSERNRFLDHLQNETWTVAEIVQHLDRTFSLDYARQKAKEYAELASEQASKFPAGPSQKILRQLPSFLLKRVN